MGECGRLHSRASEPLNTEVYNGVVVAVVDSDSDGGSDYDYSL